MPAPPMAFPPFYAIVLNASNQALQGTPPPPPSGSFLQQEIGDYVLQETSDKIILDE